MTHLSVNINKIATLRNARGGSIPDVKKAAIDCELFGAQGITVHPRPDERHITYLDVEEIRPVILTEFNVEGYPSENFINLVLKVKPDQVTLVPDPPGVLTSNAGWNTIKNKDFLYDIVKVFQKERIRTSLFVEADPRMIEYAALTGTDRIELYTESYANMYSINKFKAVQPFVDAANIALANRLGINAGHDLNLKNLRFFCFEVPGLLEVSIGHALISDALYFGLEKIIGLYLKELSV